MFALFRQTKNFNFLPGTLLTILLSLAPISNADRILAIAPYIESGVEHYQAALYFDEEMSAAEEYRALDANAMGFKIRRDRLSARSWMRDLSQRAAINSDPDKLDACADALVEMGQLIKEPLSNDDLIVVKRLESGIELRLNDIVLGQWQQPGLFDVLLSSWLGSVPPSSGFKQALVRGGASPEQAQAYKKVSNLAVRQNRIASWMNVVEDQPGEESTQTEAAAELQEPEASIASFQETASSGDLAEVVQPVLTEKLLISPPVTLEPELPVAEAKPGDVSEDEPSEADEKQRLAALSAFRRELQAHVAPYVSYPIRSQAKREQGTVNCIVTLDRQGEVLDVAVDTSSEFARLDRAATVAIQKASPFPSLPESLEGEQLEFVLPLAFRLQ